MLKRTALGLMFCVVLALPSAAAEREPEPRLIDKGTLTEEPLIAYTLEDHDLLDAQQNEDESLIERLRDTILDLKTVLAHAQERSDLHGTELQLSDKTTEFYKLQIPGFLEKHFGQCFWTGIVAGYAANEWIGNDR